MQILCLISWYKTRMLLSQFCLALIIVHWNAQFRTRSLAQLTVCCFMSVYSCCWLCIMWAYPHVKASKHSVNLPTFQAAANNIVLLQQSNCKSQLKDAIAHSLNWLSDSTLVCGWCNMWYYVSTFNGNEWHCPFDELKQLFTICKFTTRYTINRLQRLLSSTMSFVGQAM